MPADQAPLPEPVHHGGPNVGTGCGMTDHTASEGRRRFVLTGSGGYLWARLKALAVARGCSVTVLSRGPTDSGDSVGAL